MQFVQAPRASAILYNLLKSQANTNPWLLPANICPIVPITFLKAGIPIEFVDISAENLHMDLEQAKGQLERGAYGGILYAHTYGEPSTPDDFFQQIKSRYPDLLLVDDRCLCIPEFEPKTNADVVLYSTGYSKVVDLNFGGYAFLEDGIAYQPEILPFKAQDHEELERGYKRSIQNRELYSYTDSDWLQTEADLPAWYDYRQQIEKGLKASLQHRAALNEIYASRLPADIQLSQEYQTWRFNLRIKKKGLIIEVIFESGLFASSHYASLAGIMAPGQCTQAEILSKEIINLPNNHCFDQQKAERVCAAILENIS